MSTKPHSIDLVGTEDLQDILGLMRSYCEFYDSNPTDQALLELSQALIDDHEYEGLQLIARDTAATPVGTPAGAPVGFATIFWTWSTTDASRIGTMNDLYVAPQARGTGLADRLIQACVERCAERGASRLEWQTAPDNLRAQAVYDRVGGVREQWLCYDIALPQV